MFRALARWFQALLYLATGRIDRARETLDADPNVVRARYEAVIRTETGRIQQFKSAVAGLMAQQEGKKATLQQLRSDLAKQKDIMAGALAMAKKRTEELQKAGKTPEEILADVKLKTCQSGYHDAKTTGAEKEARAAELDRDVATLQQTIDGYKVQLQAAARNLQKIKEESEEAVADLISASQMQQINDAISGIALGGTGETLKELRQTVQRAKAGAQVSAELAGTDHAAQETAFLNAARSMEADSEFLNELGLAAPAAPVAEKAAEALTAEKKLPE